MPEQLTRHPDVTLQVLRSAGAQCGEGASQEILISCPRHRFCKLPGGEVCVYGLPEAGQMTQITAEDWRAVVATLRHEATSVPPAPPPPAVAVSPWMTGGTGLLLGVAIGIAIARFGRRRGTPT